MKGFEEICIIFFWRQIQPSDLSQVQLKFRDRKYPSRMSKDWRSTAGTPGTGPGHSLSQSVSPICDIWDICSDNDEATKKIIHSQEATQESFDFWPKWWYPDRLLQPQIPGDRNVCDYHHCHHYHHWHHCHIRSEDRSVCERQEQSWSPKRTSPTFPTWQTGVFFIIIIMAARCNWWKSPLWSLFAIAIVCNHHCDHCL